jgi:hypothetical protein
VNPEGQRDQKQSNAAIWLRDAPCKRLNQHLNHVLQEIDRFPMVQAADQGAAGQSCPDVLHTVVRFTGLGWVVEYQHAAEGSWVHPHNIRSDIELTFSGER